MDAPHFSRTAMLEVLGISLHRSIASDGRVATISLRLATDDVLFTASASACAGPQAAMAALESAADQCLATWWAEHWAQTAALVCPSCESETDSPTIVHGQLICPSCMHYLHAWEDAHSSLPLCEAGEDRGIRLLSMVTVREFRTSVATTLQGMEVARANVSSADKDDLEAARKAYVLALAAAKEHRTVPEIVSALTVASGKAGRAPMTVSVLEILARGLQNRHRDAVFLAATT